MSLILISNVGYLATIYGSAHLAKALLPGKTRIKSSTYRSSGVPQKDGNRCVINLADAFAFNLDLSNFLLESRFPYFKVLSVCLLFVCSVSAAEWNLFDLIPA